MVFENYYTIQWQCENHMKFYRLVYLFVIMNFEKFHGYINFIWIDLDFFLSTANGTDDFDIFNFMNFHDLKS